MKYITTRWHAASFMILILLLSACQAEIPTSLTQNSWTLTTLNGQLVPDGVITLEISENNLIAGSSGCNLYTGSFRVRGKSLSLTTNIPSLIACPQTLMQLESAYLEALRSTRQFIITDQNLSLLSAEGDELVTFTIQETVSLENTTWEVSAYNTGQGVVLNTLGDAPVVLTFGSDGILRGYSGCNQISHTYTQDGSNLQFTFSAQSRYTCREEMMRQEAQVQGALAMVSKYQILGSRLEFRASDGKLQMTLLKTEDLALNGTTWQLNLMNNQQDFLQTLLPGSQITLLLNQDGNVSGSAGCNSFMGQFTTNENELTFSPLGSTKMACTSPDGLMAQETTYLDRVQASTAYEIMGSYLLLKNDQGKITLVYQADL
jgi:heat shock protein HslJ